MLVDSSEQNQEARQEALRLARARTGRRQVIAIADTQTPDLDWNFPHVTILPGGNIGLVCKEIGEAEERIAAVVVAPRRAEDLVLKRFLRRLRELVSAEGALLIWEETQGSRETLQIAYGVKPDLTCPVRRADPADVSGGEK
jgi:glutamate-1-semialdehyde aminotransferase